MTPETLEGVLCRNFCSGLSVRAVPAGLAIGGVFQDSSGDPIEFYMVEEGDGFRLEDDGAYLSHLVAQGITIDQGHRAQILEAILKQGGAFLDVQSYEIRTDQFPVEDAAKRSVAFLSSLIRVRDMQLFTRENVKSTFREDVVAAMQAAMGGVANIEEDEAYDKELAEFPSDLVVRPKIAGGVGGMVYLVSTSERLGEAQLAEREVRDLNRPDVKVLALLEDPELKRIGVKKYQRASNRGLSMPIFRGDEDAAIRRIARELGLAQAAGEQAT